MSQKQKTELRSNRFMLQFQAIAISRNPVPACPTHNYKKNLNLMDPLHFQTGLSSAATQSFLEKGNGLLFYTLSPTFIRNVQPAYNR